jgi:hypothetical protein
MIFLKKHYFDAIAPDGSVVIVYDAMLRLFGLPWVFRYSSRLSSPSSGEMNLIHSATSAVVSGVALDDPDEVADVGSKIHVGLSDGFAATWRVLEPGWRQDILLDDRKSKQMIAWQCRAPLCEVDFGGGSPLASGYVETLRMKLPRLSFPIDKLHWGRFTSNGCSLVWIVWEGPEPRRLAWLNGEKVEIESFATSGEGCFTIRVAGADFESTLVRDIVARPLQSRLWTAMGWIAAMLPRALRRLEERKHLGRGRLLTAGGGEAEGWTLSETMNLKMDRR